MPGGPPQFLRIPAAQCAREALAGFDRGDGRVLPGLSYRIAVRLSPLLPPRLRQRQAAGVAARVRATVPGRPAVPGDRP